jgi:hypothetical protein
VTDDGQTRLVFDTDWQYEAIVTNLEWEPLDLWRFYNQRCCMENYIKEAKSGFSIDRFATSEFEANEIDLLVKLLTYNLFVRFKHDCCEPVHEGYTIARFRLEFFHCAATLIRHSRIVNLKLTKDFAYRHVWKRIEARIALLESGPPQFYIENSEPLQWGGGRSIRVVMIALKSTGKSPSFYSLYPTYFVHEP